MGRSLWESEQLKEWMFSVIVYLPSGFPNLFDFLFCGKQKVNPGHSIEYNESEWSLSSSQMTKKHHKSIINVKLMMVLFEEQTDI